MKINSAKNLQNIYASHLWVFSFFGEGNIMIVIAHQIDGTKRNNWYGIELES